MANSTVIAAGTFEVVPDVFGPEISTGPTEGDVFDLGASRRGFSVRLSESMDPESVSSETVKLLWAGPDGTFGTADDEELGARLSLTLDGRLLTVLPARRLPIGPVELVLDGLTDLSGNPLDGDGDGEPGGARSFSFTVNEADVHWINPGGGSWHDAANWDPPVVPGEGHRAHVPLTSVVVVVEDPVTIDSLELGAGSADGPTLVIDGTEMRCFKARVSSGATVRLDSLRSFGSLLRASLTVATTLENHGLIELTERNNVAGSWVPTILRVSDGALLNAERGTIRVLQGEAASPVDLRSPLAARTIDAQLENRGTLDIQFSARLIKPDAEHVSSGSIDVSGGAVFTVLGGDLENTGALRIDEGTVAFEDASLSTAGDLDIPAGSRLSIESGALVFVSGGPTGAGALSLEGGELELAEDLESSLTLELSGSRLSGATRIVNLGALRFVGPDNDVSGDVTNRGRIDVDPQKGQGSGTIAGSLRNEAEGTVRLDRIRPIPGALFSASLTVTATLENHGLIELTERNVVPGSWVPTIIEVSDGVLVNGEGGTIRVLQGEAASPVDLRSPLAARTIDARLENHGTLDVQFSARLIKPDAEHVSSGLIEVSGGAEFTVLGGDLENTGALRIDEGTVAFEDASLSTAGDLDIPAGSRLSIESGALVFASGGPTGAGALSLEGGELELAEDLESSLTLELSGSRLSGATRIVNLGALRFVGPDNDVSGDVTNRGRIDVDPQKGQGSGTIAGSLRNEAEGTVRLDSIRPIPGALFSASLTVTATLENHGLIELTERNVVPGSWVPTILEVSGGALLNAESGTIRVLQGEAASPAALRGPLEARTIDAQLENGGTLDIQFSARLIKPDAEHVSSGSIEVSGGAIFTVEGGDFTNSGAIEIEADSTVTIDGGRCTNTGTISGEGAWSAPCER